MSQQTAKKKPWQRSGSSAMRTLQRIILPERTRTETAPLYLDLGEAQATSNEPIGSRKANAMAPSVPQAPIASPDTFLSRTSAVIKPGKHASFGTYFNAFPASYWRRWTTLRSVRLHAEVEGTGSLSVFKSNSRGSIQHVETFVVDGARTVDVDLPLAPFTDGGWYWFDLQAAGNGLKLQQAEWQGADHGKQIGNITLHFTTMNKPDYCLRNLELLGSAKDVLAVLREVLIVDQGDQKVQDEARFEEVAKGLDGKLRIINQANLGGSGGFSRGMYEAVKNGSDYALLLDDDIVMEPESVIRLATFSSYCKRPTIVGGHMFDLHNRTVLHTFGETVNMWRVQPALPIEGQVLGHNFTQRNLRSTPWLHRRTDVDYNGWWMDLIPTSVIKEIGLSLPIFIKWDDVEYGLRARAAGYHTVSLPGAAVWHISWMDKDDLVGWQAYFHIRNRFITALLHSPYERGGRLIRESNYADVKHLISMQYYTEAGRLMALRDLLAGPDKLHEIQPQRIGEIRGMAKEFTDSQFQPNIDDFPPPRTVKPPRKGRGFSQPGLHQLPLWTAKTLLKQFALPVKPTSLEHPEATVAHVDNKWWRLSKYDSAVVSNAEGTAVSWYKRDPKFVRSKLTESVALHAQILSRWHELKKAYREAAESISSMGAWRQTFEKHTESELKR